MSVRHRETDTYRHTDSKHTGPSGTERQTHTNKETTNRSVRHRHTYIDTDSKQTGQSGTERPTHTDTQTTSKQVG